jgi:ribose 1,5-bisphosphokinase
MTGTAATRTTLATGPIGPGRLVLVVGPSGGGKDTILSGARAACAADASIVFARRVVTRPANEAEDHDSVSDADFAAALRDGAFALSWDAHGLRYGVPAAIDNDIRDDRIVVCNASRGIVSDARARYAAVACALITAPDELLAARLIARSRATDASTDARLARNTLYAEFSADVVIDNDDAAEDAVKTFVDYLRGLRGT